MANRYVRVIRTCREMGIKTVAVFAWEDRAGESSRFMLQEMKRRTATWGHLAGDSPTERAALLDGHALSGSR